MRLKRYKFPIFIVGLYICFLGPAHAFKVFDTTQYKNKPDLSKYGIEPAMIFYGQSFYSPPTGTQELPKEARVRELALAAKKANQFAIIDIEHWPMSGTADVVADTQSKFIQVINWMKSEAPQLKVGCYGMVPLRNYWKALKGPGSPEYKEWQLGNDKFKKLGESVDAVFPSIYTFYTDKNGWIKYAKANIAEARRVAPRKPVYVFLWPRYHESNKLLGGTEISEEFWKLQLETIKAEADGAVIWGGWGEDGKPGPAAWKEDAGWWRVTKQFMGH